MPELPEVETVVRQLAPKLIGRTIQRINLTKTDLLREISGSTLKRHLTGHRVVHVTRRAKHAVLELDSGRRLVFKPGMTGTLVHHASPPAPDQLRYAVLTLTLDDGTQLIYRDVRRIGSIWLMNDGAWARYDGALGPEPLADDFTLERLIATLQGTRQAIKKALMDQRRVVGIGNIYANEILFMAKIHPACKTSSLRRPEFEAIFRAARRKLQEAVDAQGTTLRDYRTATGDRGRFQTALEVYGRGGKPCVVCGGTLETTHNLDSRATTYCRNCQKCRVPRPGSLQPSHPTTAS